MHTFPDVEASPAEKRPLNASAAGSHGPGATACTVALLWQALPLAQQSAAISHAQPLIQVGPVNARKLRRRSGRANAEM